MRIKIRKMSTSRSRSTIRIRTGKLTGARFLQASMRGGLNRRSEVCVSFRSHPFTPGQALRRRGSVLRAEIRGGRRACPGVKGIDGRFQLASGRGTAHRVRSGRPNKRARIFPAAASRRRPAGYADMAKNRRNIHINLSDRSLLGSMYVSRQKAVCSGQKLELPARTRGGKFFPAEVDCGRASYAGQEKIRRNSANILSDRTLLGCMENE